VVFLLQELFTVEELYEAAGLLIGESRMPYEYEETPEQILERIKLDIRRLEKNLKKENGQKKVKGTSVSGFSHLLPVLFF